MLTPRRIAFINEKGGSAKTTLVSNIAAYLARFRGRRVLVIDMDPQGQLGKVFGLDTRRSVRSAIDLLLDSVLGDPALDDDPFALPAADEPPGLPIQASRTPGLDVVVANKSLALFPSGLEGAVQGGSRRLRDSLEASPDSASYDYILFDAPPSFGALTLNILCAADEVVVPVPLTYLALDGCAELMRTLQMVRSRYEHPDLEISMVVPTFYRRTRMAREILDKLKQRFPKELAHTVVGYHVKIDEAQSRGVPIFDYAPRDRGAEVMAALAEELELRDPRAARDAEAAGAADAREPDRNAAQPGGRGRAPAQG